MITLLLVIFVVGYAGIALEHNLRINKTAIALLTGVLSWAAFILLSPDKVLINTSLLEHLGNISNILFFLMGAMAIIELIDAHDGFEIITDFITVTNKKKLIWVVSFLTFFLSAVLDNLTTTIVMIALLRKLIRNHDDRLLFIGVIVIAANAGGAWSPIGDVTTTMLWIGGQISALNIILKLFIPSLISLIIPLIFISFQLSGNVQKIAAPKNPKSVILTRKQQRTVLILGISALLFVPVFKTYTHLPPFVGMMFGLSILWIYTELMHHKIDHEDKHRLTLAHALTRIDLPSILFFLGILLAVAALQSAHILEVAAQWLAQVIGNQSAIIMSIGGVSSVVDNVPIVAATQGMYSLSQYPMDDYLWEFLAFCAGTGGSILIIGSAAGVAAMGMEKINFFWYVKKISWLAIIGYLAGSFAYMAIEYVFYSH